LFFSEVGIVKNLIHNLKYRNQEQIGGFLGDWYGQILREAHLGDVIEAVIPVPLHKKRLRQRGYNQVALFAKRIAFHLCAEYVDDVLVKTQNTKTQTRKGRTARWRGNRALFTLTDASVLEHKNVLLVDDVITTGATMERCAQALQQIKGISIYLTSMAVVP